jgi:hypothetical protein
LSIAAAMLLPDTASTTIRTPKRDAISAVVLPADIPLQADMLLRADMLPADIRSIVARS